MPTFSYALSSGLIFFPFILAAILETSADTRYNYGQWLAVSLLIVFLIEIFRILYKELTIASIVEASKKFKLRKSFSFIDSSMEEKEGGISIFRFFKQIINFPGWVISYLLFPQSNMAFYFGIIFVLLTFVISVIYALEHYKNVGLGSGESTGIGVGALFGVLIIFISLRHIIDQKADPDPAA